MTWPIASPLTLGVREMEYSYLAFDWLRLATVKISSSFKISSSLNYLLVKSLQKSVHAQS